MPGDEASVNAATVKLPTLWTANISSWFSQAEAQFGLRGINQDQTKYWHVVAALDSATATRAASILDDPPNDDKYQTLKRFLLDAYGLSEQQRAQQLLSITDLGDRKPTELLDTMLRLHGKHDSQCYLFRELFLRALPPVVRQGIATSVQKDMRALAAEADCVLAACSSPCLSAAFTPAGTADDVDLYPVTGRRDVRGNPRGHGDGLCFFHHRFGDAARRCRPPCAWRQGNAQAGLRQ